MSHRRVACGSRHNEFVATHYALMSLVASTTGWLFRYDIGMTTGRPLKRQAWPCASRRHSSEFGIWRIAKVPVHEYVVVMWLGTCGAVVTMCNAVAHDMWCTVRDAVAARAMGLRRSAASLSVLTIQLLTMCLASASMSLHMAMCVLWCYVCIQHNLALSSVTDWTWAALCVSHRHRGMLKQCTYC